MNVGLFVGFIAASLLPGAPVAVLTQNGRSCHVLGGVECSHLSPLTTNYSRRLRRSQAPQCTTALINEALRALIEWEGHPSGEEPMEIAWRRYLSARPSVKLEMRSRHFGVALGVRGMPRAAIAAIAITWPERALPPNSDRMWSSPIGQ